MEQLAKLFGGTVGDKIGKAEDTYKYYLTNYFGIQEILNYLEKFPLQTEQGHAKEIFEKAFQKQYGGSTPIFVTQ